MVQINGTTWHHIAWFCKVSQGNLEAFISTGAQRCATSSTSSHGGISRRERVFDGTAKGI
jgi:hypothetical protein